MQIIELEVNKLYGYIDKKINFYEDINLLVGINGAGKTSILNILNWLLQPAVARLSVTEFNKITLKFYYKNTYYSLVCEHIKNELIYSLYSSDGEEYYPLNVPISHHPKIIGNNRDIETHLMDQYKYLRPDENEEKIWNFIHSLPNPVVIGLDRSIYAEESNGELYISNNSNINNSESSTSHDSPLDRIKKIVNMNYRRRKNSILTMTNKLKNSLMISAFDEKITKSILNDKDFKLITTEDINYSEAKLRKYFRNLEKEVGSGKDNIKIDRYFENLKYVVRDYENNKEDEVSEIIYKLNINQFSKVEDLLKDFERFEKRTHSVMRKIDEYLDTLNFFLKDSSKRIVFKEDTSEIAFHTLDKQGNILLKNKDIRNLSSGEQQILILFSYIAFNKNEGRVFIIDEPELSLHIKWQEHFLEKLNIIRPEGTQLILATHSPILANKMRNKAILLLPYTEEGR
ncbi:AAA family ATPase [Psychrobacter nivimaris]|uniref:AAA family ATPase n=1 Tax=Psychrobacter nivimaris TaxID=281738 RepID=UPI003736B206